MQRERNSLDSFPEPIDLNQGSVPSNPSIMDHSSSWDNMLSPVENRLSNYMLGPEDGNPGCSDDADDDTCHNFSGWARGESSSGANNSRGGYDSKTNFGWPSSLFTSCSGHGPDLENLSFEPPSNTGTASSEPLSMQNYDAALSLNSNNGHTREQIPTFYASSSNNIGAFTTSSSASGENNSTWGSSCKRKALEGTSGQFYPPGGSSPTNQNIMHHHSHIPDFYASRGNLRISSSGTSGSSPTNYSEQINPSQSGVSMSRQSLGFFPSSRGLAESPSRNLTSRPNHGRHEPVLFETPRGISSSSRNSGVYSSPSTTNPNAALNQSPHPMHVNEARGTYPYTWNGQSFNTRGSGSSEEAPVTNIRTSSSRRENNLEYPNVTRDQIDWSFAPGNSNRLCSRNHSPSSSGSRVGPSSSSSAWLRYHQNPNPNHQRLSEGSGPWVPLHGSGTESGIRRSHYLSHLPASSSSSEEVGPSSRGQRRLDQRSAAGFLMDAQGEDINGWRSLAAVEGRHRLIRQVLTAMRRGVHLQGEEYMLVDPFMNGFAELHDRHSDMRLDVDNMSYEELLALEDRIGSVSTGLSEERIRSSLKQRKFKSFCVLTNMEPCCICQENYITGDDIGILDCGHEFHTACVEQWLTQKNTCPICKMTALET